MADDRKRVFVTYALAVAIVVVVATIIAQLVAATALATGPAATDPAVGATRIIVGILTTIGTVLVLYSLPAMATAIKQGERFDKRKIARTLILGAIVGAFLGSQGMGVSNESVAFGEQFVQTGFGGIIVVFLDKLLSYVFTEPSPTAHR